MNILDILRQLRDDIKTWTTNNLKYLNNKIEANKTASEKKDTELDGKITNLKNDLDTHEHTLSEINTGYRQAVDENQQPVVDKDGNPVMETVTLERILTNMQTTTANNKTELENKINTNTSNIQANANAISANKATLDAEDDRLESLINTNKSTIETNKATLDAEDDRLESLINTNANDIDALEGRATALETRADKLEAAMPKIVILSQEEYNALEAANTVDNETFYLIKD